jgi:DNA (cytosine-5)-methyltransferase 1
VFENVEGFLTAEDGYHVLELLDPLIAAGYQVHLQKVNAANFGVPQHRKRVIAIGGLGWTPTFPQPTHSAFGAPGAHLAARHLPRALTLADAISGLPAPAAEPPGEPTDHYASRLFGVDLQRAKHLSEGQTMRDLPEELQHESYRRRAFRRVMDGTPTDRRGGAPAGLRRLRADEPCKAITGAARAEFLHPKEDRYLTLRECARIQTFPDSFTFAGSPSDRQQLIGNAVPPRLARALASSLRRQLEAGVTASGDAGRLLTFVPTLSLGMSPALTSITERVRRRYSLAPTETPVEQIPLWS